MFSMIAIEVSHNREEISTKISDMNLQNQNSKSTWKLEEVYFDHYGDLVKMARLLVDDLSSASDVVQESFAKALKAQPMFTNSDAYFYMKRAVMNSAKSQLRKRQVSRKHLSAVPVEESNLESKLEAEVELPIDAQIIQKALSALSQRQRECVVAFHSQKMSYKEIARLLNISEGSVKQHLHRGLKNLSTALGGAK